MELQKAARLSGFATVVRYVVGGQPELAEPYVQKKNCEKTSQIKKYSSSGTGLPSAGAGMPTVAPALG